MSLVIAVDGPSGTGKSSTCRGVAQRLGLAYLDTGAMYRAVTWAVLERGIDPADAAAVAALAQNLAVQSGTDPSNPTISVDGVDVAGPIRGAAVTAAVSLVSAIPQVRTKLVGIQQQVINQSNRHIVVEGRDIGTVVVPNAELKIYLTAHESARVQRRAKETGADAATTAAAIGRRDHLDSSRVTSPLAQADDAIVVDTTDMSLTEVIDYICQLAQR